MPVPTVPPEFDQMSTAEKIEYVQSLWERIAEEAAVAGLTDAQRDELDRRLEVHRKNSDELVSWDEVRKRIRGRNSEVIVERIHTLFNAGPAPTESHPAQ